MLDCFFTTQICSCRLLLCHLLLSATLLIFLLHLGLESAHLLSVLLFLLLLLRLINLLPNVLVDHAAAVKLWIGSRRLTSSLKRVSRQLLIGVELLKLVSQILLGMEVCSVELLIEVGKLLLALLFLHASK